MATYIATLLRYNQLGNIIMALYIVLLIIAAASPAVMHSHSANLNKERTEDGAYNPRDQGHYSSSEDHNNEFDHEAILGSAKDADEFDGLPKEEARRRLKVLLLKMDLNNDNQIDKQELKAWILRSFR